MARPKTKAELRQQMMEEFALLEEFLAPLTPEQMLQPDALGTWSVKDVLAHLYEWHRMFFDWYEAGLRGKSIAVPAEGYKWNQLPVLNRQIWRTYKDLDLAEAWRLLRGSHTRMVSLVDSLPEADIFQRGLYPWMGANALLAFFHANGAAHYRWAREGIRKGLRKRAAQQESTGKPEQE